jgi:aminopeptidase N
MINTFLLGVVSVMGVSWATPLRDDYPKNPNIDVLNYIFRLTLSDGTEAIRGEATVDARFLVDGITEITLDLINESPQRDGRGMTVVGVVSETGPLDFQHQNDRLRIHQNDRLRISLQAPSAAGQRARFRITYRGVPATGLIIGNNKHGDRTFFSDNWPNKARHWLPTVDHPYDKATCEFIVIAPNHYQVISNGLKMEETDLPDGVRLTHWKQSVPIASWLYVLGVARFAVQYVGEHDFAVPTKHVLQFYGDMIGPFAYEKLANVQSNSVRGGMEAATAIFYGDASVTGRRDRRWRNVIIHEVAHQWFGNSVTEYDWDDVWLSEGFATYFTLLFIEHAYGRDEFVEGLKSSRQRVLAFYERDPDYRIVHDNLTDMSRVTSSQTYQKGGWTLHMLRGLIGDDAFWKGVREYYRLYRDGNATTADFRRAMEEASGRDLSRFFEQWLYEGGFLKLAGGWRYDARAARLEVELTQVQNDGTGFQMPVQLGIYHDEGTRPLIEVLEVSGVSNRFTIPLEREPVDVVLDPYTWVLMEAEFARR